ncbi:hypothetical protein RCL_jg25182.t1 [Rhizophagus clarus]|uniref:Uncharacterized protein n=1 Tax=Rhizophagus clarus TaxID=94130 RepID=A0A8H3QT43_9GLOM|nr:hypothetical protein RCL_jg25182.t1 [Rhizophagus clarus]
MIDDITVHLTILKTLMNERYTKEFNKWQLNRITTAIETREQNYKLSPTKLLNSILERKPNKINLSKISIYSNITDLPQQWQDIYRRKIMPIKDQELLLTPITHHELTETLKSLSNNKAAGLNSLTYEI